MSRERLRFVTYLKKGRSMSREGSVFRDLFGKSNARIEGDKDALVKNHGGVSAGNADFAVGRFTVHKLCGGDIGGSEACIAGKPDASAHANKKSPRNQVIL